MLITKKDIPLLAPALLLCALSFIPVVMATNGYTYSFVEPKTHYIIGLCFLLTALNVQSSRKAEDVRRWLQITAFAVLALIGSWTWALNMEGFEWVIRQTAIDTPAKLRGTAQYEIYWNTFRAQLGDVRAFGGIQAMYERYGAGVQFNNQQIFVNTINSADLATLKNLLDESGSSTIRMPLGLLAVLLACVFQIGLYRKISVATVANKVTLDDNATHAPADQDHETRSQVSTGQQFDTRNPAQHVRLANLSAKDEYRLTCGLGLFGLAGVFLSDLAFFSINGVPAALIAALICALIFRARQKEDTDFFAYKRMIFVLAVCIAGSAFVFTYNVGGFYFSTAFFFAAWGVWSVYKQLSEAQNAQVAATHKVETGN